jgi:hypothetical protein
LISLGDTSGEGHPRCSSASDRPSVSLGSLSIRSHLGEISSCPELACVCPRLPRQRCSP